MASPVDQKTLLRSRLREQTAALSATDRARASRQASDRLRATDAWKAAKTVLFYSALPDELDLGPLVAEALASGKCVAFPRFDSNLNNYKPFSIINPATDLARGRYGIFEPAAHCTEVAINQLDLIMVPGVGFDAVGRRLGRGKGYYDRLLAQVSGIKCGAAFDFQVVAEVPAEPHDVRLDCILTPTRWPVVASHRPVKNDVAG